MKNIKSFEDVSNLPRAMEGFKIICNKCGKESTIQQDKYCVDIEGNIEIEYYDRYYDNNEISFICECGNKVSNE